MRKRVGRWWLLPVWAVAVLAVAWLPGSGQGACCYFSAKDKDVLQPGQKVFITWDPMEKVESWTVQPKFEGNASDFGMVIPSPSQPKLDEMPRDFFKELALYSLLKKREQPASKLLPMATFLFGGGAGGFGGTVPLASSANGPGEPRKPAIKVLEAGVVGNLDYKIIEAGRADDL